MARPIPRAAALLLAALLLAVPAQALFIQTPLRLTADKGEAEVGDTVTFTIEPEPENASARDDWKGETVRVVWEEVAMGDEPGHTGTVREAVGLDADANATFPWTVPARVDDMNLIVVVTDGKTRLAQFHLRVGDAEPIMFAMGGAEVPPPAGDPPANNTGSSGNVTGGAGNTGGTSGDGTSNGAGNGAGAPQQPSRTPGLEGLAVLAGLAAVALLAARRKR
jgi:hypothetical protein